MFTLKDLDKSIKPPTNEYILLEQNDVNKDFPNCSKEYNFDKETIFNRFPVIKELFELFPDKFVIAGGAVAGWLFNCDFNDIDIFLIGDDLDKQRETIIEMVNVVKSMKEYHNIIVTDNAVTLDTRTTNGMKESYQFIPSNLKSGLDIINIFDFGACMFYFDGNNVCFNIHGKYCLETRCFYAIDTFCHEKTSLRIFKYINKGFAFLTKSTNIELLINAIPDLLKKVNLDFSINQSIDLPKVHKTFHYYIRICDRCIHLFKRDKNVIFIKISSLIDYSESDYGFINKNYKINQLKDLNKVYGLYNISKNFMHKQLLFLNEHDCRYSKKGKKAEEFTIDILKNHSLDCSEEFKEIMNDLPLCENTLNIVGKMLGYCNGYFST
jgi:hypothetical protein